MQPHMENPPLAKRGVPETDLAGALINGDMHAAASSSSLSPRSFNAAMAETLAPLVFLGALR